MTFGFSRDDAGKFLEGCYDAKIYENDPFATLSLTKVKDKGVLNYYSSVIAHLLVDYVSCSPFRVPIARLAAAQAAIASR